MIKILEFIEVGEYEAAWSLAIATGREESLFSIVTKMAEEASEVEVKAYNYYIEIRNIPSTDKYSDKLPFHNNPIAVCEKMCYNYGTRAYDRAHVFYNAHVFIKGELNK